MIRVISKEESILNDGSVWITYIQDDKYFGFELCYDTDKTVKVNRGKIKVNNLNSKYVMIEALLSDDELYCIDQYDDIIKFEAAKISLQIDFDKYPVLKDYIEFESINGEESIVIYKNILIELLFNCTKEKSEINLM